MTKTLRQLEQAHKVLDLGDALTFGKYKGSTVFWLLDQHPGYLVWVHENTNWKLKTRIYDQAKELFEAKLVQILNNRAEQDYADFQDEYWDEPH
jgi:hypothetical protein